VIASNPSNRKIEDDATSVVVHIIKDDVDNADMSNVKMWSKSTWPEVLGF